MTVLDLVISLRRHWKAASAVFLLFMLAAVGITVIQSPVYHASSRVLIGPTPTDNADVLNRRLQYVQGNMATYSELVASETVGSKVADQMKDPEVDASKASRSLKGSFDTGVNMVTITASGSSPDQATRLADTAATVLGTVVTDTEHAQGTDASPVRFTVVDRAQKPTSATSPRWPVNLLVGMVLGIVAAVTVSVLLHVQGSGQRRRRNRVSS